MKTTECTGGARARLILTTYIYLCAAIGLIVSLVVGQRGIISHKVEIAYVAVFSAAILMVAFARLEQSARILPPMPIPTGVTVSALLMMLAIVAGLVLSYIHVLRPGVIGFAPSISISRATILLFYWAFSAVMAIVVYFYWNAHNWARILVLIDSVSCLMPVEYIHHKWVLDRFSGITFGYTVLSFGRALLAIYLLWYLNTRAIRVWFAGKPVTPNTPDHPARRAIRTTTHFLFKSPFKRH